MFVCVILCICRTRICERKNSPSVKERVLVYNILNLEKASLLGNHYTEKVGPQVYINY
jgi:hypothetical protein